MKLQITKEAEKAMKRLDKTTRMRIVSGIKKLPEGDIRKLKGLDYYYRLRIGNYRVIYFTKGETIIITDVLPRGEAYKRL